MRTLQKMQQKMSYVQIIALGYFLLILLGSLLLFLPFATAVGEETSFLTAVFTATSATCVTGLVVVDTYMHWTVFGKIVILLLIQVGGLGFMTMGVLFAMCLKQRITLRTRGILQESINALQVGGVVRLVKHALIGTAIVEAAGAALLSIRFIPVFGWGKGILFGIFHAVSAFCNAGFDLMGEYSGEYSSLTSFDNDIVINVVIMALIIIGGLGFAVWEDIRTNRFRVKRYRLHTKLVLLVTGILLLGGTALFYLLEKDNLMAGMGVRETLLTSAFSAVTARTAGFNTIDTGALTEGSKFLTIVLMFIGGSPGSTAGGIKTVTLMVLIAFVWSNLRHATGCNLFGRRLDEETVKKASTVMMISLMLVVTATITIAIIQPLPLLDVIFEIVSAIGTVGMSTGITRDLSSAVRVIIILLMYCGRLGSMSLALSFTERRRVAPIQLPTEKIMIG